MEIKSDFELINEFKDGNVEGFNGLVRRYQERVYWIARRMLDSHQDADDIVQNVFMKVFEKLKDFRAESGFYTWIYRVTVNTCINEIHKKRIKEILSFDHLIEEPVSSDRNPLEENVQKEYQSSIKRAVEKLPPKQKAVFVMRFYEELTYNEIAEILKTSVSSLKSSYSFALKKIKEHVKKEVEP